MLELLSYPFMQRALISGIMISLVLGWIGTFLVSRKMSFIGDGIAHASLGGIALAIILGIAPLPTALVFGVMLAIILFFIEKKTDLSQDTTIGLLFTTSMAVGIILMHFHEGYQPELMSYLFGNILAINTVDLWTIGGVGAGVLLLLSIFNRQMTFITFDKDGAYLSGISPARYDLIFYIMTTLAIITSVKLVGIILVSALIITPSAAAKLIARSFSSFQKIAMIIALTMTIAGLTLSYYLDLPSGALIILVGSAIFIILSLFFKQKKS
ncbi:MAG: metal ABC transporter permease [Candidatus Magasanikbacteria bacterium]|nr:metal ABC transporter permease [Candidatus Magasanikbacteria bacterium]